MVQGGRVMASTSIHFPKGLLEALDRAATQSGVSRNKLVVRACKELLKQQQTPWPPGFFDPERLSEEDLAELRAGVDEMSEAIAAARRSKSAPVL